MSVVAPAAKIYGVMAEFGSSEEILEAARRATEAGYTKAEAYTPFPIDGLAEALGMGWTTVPLCTLIGGIIGGLTGFGMCWYANVINYPIQIGGRPYNSWPAWIPITFELTVLFAALTSAIAMLYQNGLPRLHHPVFNVEEFEAASHNRFFLCIEAEDPKFNEGAVRRFLEGLAPLRVLEVPE